MAYIDDIIDTLVTAINTQLAPYYPNLPPDYPNAASTAGQLPSCLVAPGKPIQYPVTTRLENKQATVVVYDGPLERDMPFLNEQPANQEITEISRAEKQLIIEVWSYDQPTRRAITNQIRALIGDFIRLTESDGTTTVHRYTRTVKQDSDQKDSVYINQVYLMSDYTVTVENGSALIETTDLSLEVEDANGDLLQTFTQES
jgi:hypothetical protein